MSITVTIKNGVTTIQTQQTQEPIQKYRFGAGRYKKEPRLLIYNPYTGESQHYNKKTSLKIVESLLEHRAYIIENTEINHNPPQTYEEFLETTIYAIITIGPEEVKQLTEIKEFLKGRLNP